jgi:phosphohistidine phosphatase
MRVLVIRHAHAAQQVPGVPDAERPLTTEGERRFRAAARGLARLVRPDVLLTSPLRRARQTAAIAAAAWGAIEATPEPALASGNLAEILGALEAQPPDATIAVVGHEPTVSALVAELVGARTGPDAEPPLSFTPGAAALLEVSSIIRRSGRLVWFYADTAAAALGGVGGSRGLPPRTD